MTPERETELKAKHPIFKLDIPRFDVSDDDDDSKRTLTVYLRKPKPIEIKRFNQEAVDEDRRANALENLARACIVEPDGNNLQALLFELPALPITVGEHLLKLAGAVKGTEIKKV